MAIISLLLANLIDFFLWGNASPYPLQYKAYKVQLFDKMSNSFLRESLSKGKKNPLSVSSKDFGCPM
jgi:hypothetical protein